MSSNYITDRLELISLRDSIISFNRLNSNAVRYHHWHQCLEILYIEDGCGVVIADNRHYTVRPGRFFIFPPFTLHKIMVEERVDPVYRRTIIHVDQYEIFKYFNGFPQHQTQFQQLCTRGSEAFVTEVPELHAGLNSLFTHFSNLEKKMGWIKKILPYYF